MVLPAVRIYLRLCRIVIDENVPAVDYKNAVEQIHKVSFIMVELLDYFDMKTYLPSAFNARTKEYLDTLGEQVDIWEIGNEING